MAVALKSCLVLWLATFLAAQSVRQPGQLASRNQPQQSQDVTQRIRRAFEPAGQTQVALAALSAKQYATLGRMLSELHPHETAELAEVRSLQGVVSFMEGKMEAAVDSFTQAARIAPLKDADSFTFAMACVYRGDAEAARTALTALSTKHPHDAIYLYWLGRIDYYQRRYEEAVENLKKASGFDPASARIWNSLGLAYDMQGLTEPARQALETAAELNRKEARPSPWPPHDLGFLLLRTDRAADAEPLLLEALKYDANMPEAHLHLGRALEAQGRNEAAIPEYEAAVRLDPSSPDACYPLALLYKKLHREADSEAMFAEFKKRKSASALAAPAQPK